MKKNLWVPIAMFVVMIFGGMIWSIASPDQAYSDTENRFLAEKPQFSWEALFAQENKYTEKYETYITDQFPMRDTWIGFKSQVEKLLGKVETKDVYLGKEDYLIVNYPAADFEGEQAVKNVDFLAQAVASYIQSLGEDHVRVMLVPTASQILTDKLPKFAMPYDQNIYVTKVQKALTQQLEAAGVADGQALAEQVMLDVQGILMSKNQEEIYYRTDHHWTTLGAFYGYQAWAESVGMTPLTDPALKTVDEAFQGTTYSKLHTAGRNDVIQVYDTQTQVELVHNQQNTTQGFYDWSKLEVRDKYAMFLGGNDALLEIIKGEAGHRKTEGQSQDGLTFAKKESVLLVVKDSFANCFVPYATEHFDGVVVVDLRYLNMPLSMIVEEYGVTDLLVLYNVQAAATDNSVFKMTR